MEYEFTAKLWLYNGKAAWHFITLPQDIADEIREIFSSDRIGWGSIRVSVTIGRTRWNTSIFPDKKSKSYLLPVKTEVRHENSLADGDETKVRLQINP